MIELLTVIAVLGLLMGILLPALQLTREQAKRTRCTNNLKQIGLALAAYTTHHGGLPLGYSSNYDAKAKEETGPGWGWASMILPYLEQQPLFDQIQFEVSLSHARHATVRTTPLAVFLCPSDQMSPTWTATQGSMWYYQGNLYTSKIPISEVAGANYVGMFGIGEPGVDGDGVFFRNSFVTPRNIADGLSNTICVGERSISLSAGRGEATWTGVPAGSVLWTCVPDPYDPDGGVCRQEAGAGMILGHTGESHGPGDPWGDVNQFLSRHDEGAFFLFCDGHVRFLKRTVNYKAYLAMSTRAGGEYFDQDF